MSLKPLFKNKPIVIVLNKIDLISFEELEAESKEMLLSLKNIEGVTLIELSNKSGDGIGAVKDGAC